MQKTQKGEMLIQYTYGLLVVGLKFFLIICSDKGAEL